jgi:hypothetical protein
MPPLTCALYPILTSSVMVYQPHYREFPRPVHIQDGLLRVTNTNHITGSFPDQFIFKTDCFVLQTPTTLPGVSPTSSYSRLFEMI